MADEHQTQPEGTPAPTQSRATRQLVVFAVLSLLFLSLGLFTPVKEWFNTERIQAVSHSLGYRGPLLILAIGLVAPLLFLPRWPIAVVCGLLYGVAWGAALANVASTLGAWLHFYFARTLLAPTSERVLRRYGWDRLKVPPNKVFAVLFLLRAFPLSSFVATNILAGSLNVHVGVYLAASFLGMIPSTIMYAAWGKATRHQSVGFAALLACTLVLIIIGTMLAQRYFLPWMRGMRGR